MLQNKAYAAYANNKIMTASPAELTLMLYDGAIKFCNIAIMAVEKKDIDWGSLGFAYQPTDHRRVPVHT